MSDSPDAFAYRGSGRTFGRVLPLIGAMLASVAFLCVTASSAMAVEPVGLYLAGEKSGEAPKQPRFEAEKYTSTLEGDGQSTFKFGVNAGTVQCQDLTLSGQIAAASTALPVSPFYWACSYVRLGLSYQVNILPYGCGYVIDVQNAGPPYVGEFELDCPSETGYQFVLKNSKSETVCTIEYPAQSGVKGISYENTGAGSGRSVDVNFALTGLKYTQTGLPLLCPTGEYSNGTFTGDLLLSAEK